LHTNAAFSDADNTTVTTVYDESIAALFAATFLPAGSDSPPYADAYGYPRIPLLDETKFYLSPMVDGWYDTTGARTNASFYSSFYGIPWNVTKTWKSSGSYNFTIQTSYLVFGCTRLQPAAYDFLTGFGGFADEDIGSTLGMKFQWPDGQSVANGTLGFASAINPAQNTNSTYIISPNTTYAYSTCNFTQTFFESQVGCQGSNCSVNAIRKSPASTTGLSQMSDFSAKFLAAATGGTEPGVTNLAERYLCDPSTVTSVNDPLNFDMTKLPCQPDAFPSRLALLVNTFWQLGYAPEYQTGNFSANNTDSIPSLLANPSRYTTPPRYNTSTLWLVIYMFCSAFLFFVGVSGLIVESVTVSPDILGFASSLAKPSKYLKLPEELDGTVGGAERARILENLRVMIQDVNPNGKVGMIGLGNVTENSHRLDPNRLYR